MKPHLHQCPTCGITWTCRGFTCGNHKSMECPDCDAGETPESDREDDE